MIIKGGIYAEIAITKKDTNEVVAVISDDKSDIVLDGYELTYSAKGLTYVESEDEAMSKKDKERALETIDMLGVALADEGHAWTTEERSAYEKTTNMLKK